MADADHRAAPLRRRLGVWGWLLVVICVGFAVFWVWALFFASKEAVNKIGDRAWAARAEGICATAKHDVQALHDFRRIDHDSPQLAAMLAERADIVDQATDIVEHDARRRRRRDADRRQGPGPRAAVGGRLPHVHRATAATYTDELRQGRRRAVPRGRCRRHPDQRQARPASPATTTCRRAPRRCDLDELTRAVGDGRSASGRSRRLVA